MNKLIVILLCLLPWVGLKADGYPFNVHTHEVYGPNLRLHLNEAQQTEVASLGCVTFTQEQLGWLRRLYPGIPLKLRVISSTHNDGLDIRDPNPVDCIWTAPAEVGITMGEKHDAGDYSFDSGECDRGDIRISPTGLLYHEGKEISLARALEIVKTSKKPDVPSATGLPSIRVTRPPPFRALKDAEAKNKKVADMFNALTKYGESVKVDVYPTW